MTRPTMESPEMLLARLLDERGPAIYADRLLCRAVLSDAFAPRGRQGRAEMRLLIAAVDAGVAGEARGASSANGAFTHRLAETGLKPEEAEWAIAVWAAARTGAPTTMPSLPHGAERSGQSGDTPGVAVPPAGSPRPAKPAPPPGGARTAARTASRTAPPGPPPAPVSPISRPSPSERVRTQKMAVAAMVVAVLSLALGPIVAVVAVGLARGAKRQIRASGGRTAGMGWVGAARVTAVLAMLVWIAGAIAVGYVSGAEKSGTCVRFLGFTNSYC